MFGRKNVWSDVFLLLATIFMIAAFAHYREGTLYGQSAAPESAILVIYRRDAKHNSGVFIKPVLSINGHPLLRLPDKRYFQMEIRPGTYTLDVNLPAHKFLKDHTPGAHGGSTGAAEEINIQPGSTCYMMVTMIKPLVFGIWHLTLVRAARDQALLDLPKLRRLQTKWIQTGEVYKLQEQH